MSQAQLSKAGQSYPYLPGFESSLRGSPTTRGNQASKATLNIKGSNKPAPILQLADYSRYGNHTLELSKEIMERVTVKQMGRIGGGQLGSVQKTMPDR